MVCLGERSHSKSPLGRLGSSPWCRHHSGYADRVSRQKGASRRSHRQRKRPRTRFSCSLYRLSHCRMCECGTSSATVGHEALRSRMATDVCRIWQPHLCRDYRTLSGWRRVVSSAARISATAASVVSSARYSVHFRRSASQFWPHRFHVCLHHLWPGTRPGGVGQRAGQRRGRQRGGRGSELPRSFARGTVVGHLERQPAFLCRRVGHA